MNCCGNQCPADWRQGTIHVSPESAKAIIVHDDDPRVKHLMDLMERMRDDDSEVTP